MPLLEQLLCFQHVPPRLAQNVVLRTPHHCVPDTGTVRWAESGGVGAGTVRCNPLGECLPALLHRGAGEWTVWRPHWAVDKS